MTDARSLADDAVQHLDRLGAVILDDVGDGPMRSEFAIRANEAHDAATRVGVAAFSELTGLIVGVGRSLVAGTTDWSPSLGGTLMAAVDDLRTLVMRAANFTAEDSEHLHQRATDLANYVRVPAVGHSSSTPPETKPSSVSEPTTTASPIAVTDHPKSAPTNQPTDDPTVVPISALFFADGPSVVKGGVPKSAGAASDLLGAGIDALDDLNARTLAEPLASATRVIPVEALIYRGRAALERAAAIREQIRASGASAPAAVLDEMYDLIGLALND